MHDLIIECSKRYKGLLAFVIIVSVISIGVYLFVGVAKFGEYTLSQYFPLFMYLFMYFSIIKYINDFFKKGKEEASIESMLVRFSACMVATLITSRYGNDIIFVLMAMIILLSPYLSGNLKKPKKAMGLLVLVFLAVAAISIIRTVTVPENALSDLVSCVYYFDAWNITIQWTIFCILYIVRGKVYLECLKSQAE